jgi:hypothetical protein
VYSLCKYIVFLEVDIDVSLLQYALRMVEKAEIIPSSSVRRSS